MQQLPSLFLVGPHQPHDLGHLGGMLAKGLDDALGHLIGARDAPEDVQEDRLDVGVRQDDAQRGGPDFIFGWPTVEFAPTGPESIVQAVFHKELSKAKEEGKYEELYQALLNPLREQFSVMNMGRAFTTYYTVHEVIDPRDTRTHIIKALHAAVKKHEVLPDKKRYIKPA